METMTRKAKLTIDGQEVLVDEGLTVLEAARQIGINIPTLCHHDALSNYGGCRMCVVEVDGSPKLAASCVTPVRSGMEVVTSNEYIIENRRTVLEFIFAERNHNCMFCPRSGDCELQQLAYDLQMDHLTVSFSFDKFPADVTSEYMAIDHNRCILCGRCVRACSEIAGAHVLDFQNRGTESLIGMDLNETRAASTCYNCGPCLQVCPTGAITSRYRSHYAVKGLSRDWRQIESVCSQCGLLCPTYSWVNDNCLLKIEGHLFEKNGRPDRGQLCYRGRFEVLKNPVKRVLRPMVREANGSWRAVSWENALDVVAERLLAIQKESGSESLFGLASSSACNEALICFRDLMRLNCSAGYVDSLDGPYFRTALSAENIIPAPFREASWRMIPDADMILLLGAAPYQSQPLIASLVRRSFLETDTKVAILGSTDVFALNTPYVFPSNDSDLPSLIRALDFQEIEWNRAQSNLKKIGFNPAAIAAFREIRQAFTDALNPIVITGRPFGIQDPFVLAEAFRLAYRKGFFQENTLRLVLLKPGGNSAGAWKLGISSAEEPGYKNRWRGGLLFLGETDAMNVPGLDPGKAVDFLTVVGPHLPENLADKAQVMLPAPLWAEEGGTFTSLDGHETAYRKKTLTAPEGLKDSWEIFFSLAERVGFLPEYRTREELSQRAVREIEEPALSG